MVFGHVELQECSVWEKLWINILDDGYSCHTVHIYHPTQCQLYRRNKRYVNSLQYAYITYSIWMHLCRCRYIMQMTEAMLYPIFTNWIFCVWWYLLYTRYHKLKTLHAASSYSYHIYTITRTFFMSWSH